MKSNFLDQDNVLPRRQSEASAPEQRGDESVRTAQAAPRYSFISLISDGSSTRKRFARAVSVGWPAAAAPAAEAARALL